MGKLAALGPIVLALAVGMGAFGAHALKDRLDPYALSVYEKAVFYHFIHGFALLIVTVLSLQGTLPTALAQRLSLLFLGGVLLFSGSLYLLALSGLRWLGAITPLGGTAFILGWLWLAWGLLRTRAP